jgi:alkaline phosphatase D
MHRLNRRDFLISASLSSLVLALPGCSTRPTAPTGEIALDRARFPQSLASGDPRPQAVLLWTRLQLPEAAAEASLWLQVSATADFAQPRALPLLARAEHNGCIRIRLTDLMPGTRYYYRFVIDTVDGWRSSPIGRTRTAPAADSEAPLRFALLSCQDYGGRWYNSLLPLLEEELDFVLHVGDFIYESRIVFDDLDGAIKLGSAERPYYAARSLDNYRQLHRTVRTDPVLQQLLERAPLIAIWDDHEFADDSWQDVATHRDGRVDERDRERRRNAEQAWFEYLPADPEGMLDAQGAAPAREALFPATRIWRGLRFGRVLDLALIDTRSERPDHLVLEDAFPGELLYTEAELGEALPGLGVDPATLDDSLLPYIDLDSTGHAALKPTLVGLLSAAALREGLSNEAAIAYAQRCARGRIALPVLDALLRRWNASAPEAMRAVIPMVEAAAGRGLCWASLGKTGLFSSVGSRYFVLQAPWQAFAALRGAQDSPLSPAQRDWLLQRLQASDAVWKTVASSISFTPIELDLSLPELGAPPLLARRFLLNVDHWDGFPLARRALLDAFDAAGGALLLSGDIHAAFATQHSDRTFELTTPAVSSTTLADILASEVERDPNTADVGRRMVDALDRLIVHGDPRVRHARTRLHGVSLIEAHMDALDVQLLCLPPEACRTPAYDDSTALRSQTQITRFRVDAASRRLQPA